MSEPNMNTPDPSMNPLEASLRALEPVASRLNRDALMFQAGRAGVASSAGRRHSLAWPLATAALALIAAGEGLALVRPTPPQAIDRLVVVRETEPTPTTSPALATIVEPPRSIRPPRTSTPLTPYQRLGRQIALYGLDALPSPPRAFAAAEPQSSSAAADLLRDEIDLILNPGDPS